MPENKTYFIEQWTDHDGITKYTKPQLITYIEVTLLATIKTGQKTDCYFIIKPKTNKA